MVEIIQTKYWQLKNGGFKPNDLAMANNDQMMVIVITTNDEICNLDRCFPFEIRFAMVQQ